MNQYTTERRLTWCYGLIAALLTISVICIATPYNHWSETLDVCPSLGLENINCRCIFYGIRTSQYFNGGHSSYCLYAIIAPLPMIVYSIIMVLFHMYRVCIKSVGKFDDAKSTTMEEIEGEAIVATSRARISHNNDSVIYCWVPTACIALIFFIYNLVHASLITHGFFKTCSQYREYAGNRIGASGNHLSVILFRLSCQAIFDFMDYIHPDALNRRRADYINTGLSLQLALIASWVSVILWIAVFVHTLKRAYKERNILTCCGN